MGETIITQQEIAARAEEAARYWAQHPREDAPICPYPASSEARARWNALFQRNLLLYSSVSACEEPTT
jgi:hypothetical protein